MMLTNLVNILYVFLEIFCLLSGLQGANLKTSGAPGVVFAQLHQPLAYEATNEGAQT